MDDNLTLEEEREIRRNNVYALVKNAYYNQKPHESASDILTPIARRFGYKNYMSVYNIMLEKKELDPKFQKWWKESGKKKPKKAK